MPRVNCSYRLLVPGAGLEPARLVSERFSYHYSFHYPFSLWSGLYLHHSIATLDARRLVSTRSKVFLLRLRSVLAFYSLHRI
jgi:hypothetical protein